MVAPGGGAGNAAAARAKIGQALNIIREVFMGLPHGSPEFQAAMRAMTALQPFMKESEGELGGATRRNLANVGAAGNPLAGTPSPGIQSAPMPIPPGAAGPNGPGM